MTGQAVGEVLAFAVGIALSPLAIVAVVVMLVAPRGTKPAWAFVGAWALSLLLVSSLLVLLADGADAETNGGPATWVSVLKIVVGLLLVLFAARQWRGRVSHDADGSAPGWLRKLDDVNGAKAAGLAVVFAVVKPKNLLLMIGAAIAVAQTGASASGQAAAIAVFVALASTGVASPLAVHVVMPGRGRDLLASCVIGCCARTRRSSSSCR
jgi:hypothetical protein